MNQSRRITWLVFIVGVIAVVDVLGWVSWRLVTFEREQQQSREEAARQEAIGRALWRMDSIVLPLLAVESARPYWEYQAFYPANRPADQMWLPPAPGDVLVPSPLLGEPGDLVRLHFERDGAGRLASPQAPGGDDRLSALAAGVPEALLAMADIRLYELDRLDGRGGDERGRFAEAGAAGVDLIDRIGEEPAVGLDEVGDEESRASGRVLAIDPDDALVQNAAPPESAPGRGWFDRREPRARGEEARAGAAPAEDEFPAAPRSVPPGLGEADMAIAPGAGREQSMSPLQSAGETLEPADMRQDYEARQRIVENVQTYNDAGRANRGRGYDGRTGYQTTAASEPVTRSNDERGPEPESATPAAIGAGDETQEATRTRSLDRGLEARREVRPAATPEAAPAAGNERAAQPATPSSPGAPIDAASVLRDAEAAPQPGETARPENGEGADLEALAGVRSQGSAPGVEANAPQWPSTEALVFDQPVAGLVPEAGPLMPMWRGSPAAGGEAALVLVRRVSVNGEAREQGVWIDWPALRRGLEASVADLFPLAEVQPVSGAASRAGASEAQRLATLPVVLIPGPLAAGVLPAAPGFWTPTRWTLLVGWIAVGIAVVAIGIVLRKAIDLGERRGRFVSAVTHELRTPLTTFRLYSQMLAGNAAMDEGKRTRYAQTLDRESQRLSGIVESVLEYARLGRRAGGAGAVRQRVDPAAIIERARPALAGRAERAGMDLVLPEAGSLPAGAVVADPDKLERILLNLVDNACKYAAESDDRRVVIDAGARDGNLVLGVRDFGPGIPPDERRRIFDAFHRARHHEASASPGLGLGLALSRGLAREMGGELRLVESPGAGARFEVSIPMA